MDPFAKMIDALADEAIAELANQFVSAQGDIASELSIGHEDHAEEIRERMREAAKTLGEPALISLLLHILDCYGDALGDLMSMQPQLFRVSQYIDEIERVDAAGGLKYGEDVHAINDISLRRSDLKALVEKLRVPTITAEDVEAYEERFRAEDLA